MQQGVHLTPVVEDVRSACTSRMIRCPVYSTRLRIMHVLTIGGHTLGLGRVLCSSRRALQAEGDSTGTVNGSPTTVYWKLSDPWINTVIRMRRICNPYLADDAGHRLYRRCITRQEDGHRCDGFSCFASVIYRFSILSSMTSTTSI